MIPLAASNQIEIQVSAIPEATLHGDVRRLEQVFVNLLGNSLKFTPAGGHINVSARTIGRNLEVRVADDGIGIAPEFLPHVFDRFRQGDGTSTRNHSGLGLGLSIAKQLVEAHSGTIRVESAGSGQGTAFVVTLPDNGHADAVARDVTAEAERSAPRLDGLRVLVVDDEEDARELIGRALEDKGAHISLAANSHEAIRILESDDIDVLLADIAMPGDDGYLADSPDSIGGNRYVVDSGRCGHRPRAGGRADAGAGGRFSDARRQAGRARRDRAHGRPSCQRSAWSHSLTGVARGRASKSANPAAAR